MSTLNFKKAQRDELEAAVLAFQANGGQIAESAILPKRERYLSTKLRNFYSKEELAIYRESLKSFRPTQLERKIKAIPCNMK
ncbi:MAG: hypothetical protein ACMV0I_03725 [Pseudomonas sp.]